MKERWRFWLPLIWITLALLLFGILEALAHSTSLPKRGEFQERIHHAVDEALVGRDGVVLGWNRLTGEEWILGNQALLKQSFAPGSVMKILTAETALRYLIPAQETCSGHETLLGKKIFCWNSQGHGSLALVKALSQSCNLFFAHLGLKLGSMKLLETLQSYHWTQPWSSLPDAKQRTLSPIELALGESSALRVTPLQMANFWELFLRKLDQGSFSIIKQGLSLAATEGTARSLDQLKNLVLAKTGTVDSNSLSDQTDAWLVVAMPAQHPRFAWVIFLKNAHGYSEPTQLGLQLLKITEEIFDASLSDHNSFAMASPSPL